MILPPALRHRKFVLLWAGLFISIAGSQMQFWSLLWHIRELTDQPIAVSGIGLARFIPILAFALIGGLFADRYDRRRILLVTQTTMALVALALGLLTLTGQIRLGWIYLLTAVQA
ncbi:MFS transporter, partial [bacterium]